MRQLTPLANRQNEEKIMRGAGKKLIKIHLFRRRHSHLYKNTRQTQGKKEPLI